MSHTITSKLNKDAKQHTSGSGVTFFVTLGECNYDYKTKKKEWTNYQASLFAKDAQIEYYSDILRAGSIITVSGTGLILDVKGPHVNIRIIDSKLEFAMKTGTPMPDNVKKQIENIQDPNGFDDLNDEIPF